MRRSACILPFSTAAVSVSKRSREISVGIHLSDSCLRVSVSCFSCTDVDWGNLICSTWVSANWTIRVSRSVSARQENQMTP